MALLVMGIVIMVRITEITIRITQDPCSPLGITCWTRYYILCRLSQTLHFMVGKNPTQKPLENKIRSIDKFLT